MNLTYERKNNKASKFNLTAGFKEFAENYNSMGSYNA